MQEISRIFQREFITSHFIPACLLMLSLRAAYPQVFAAWLKVSPDSKLEDLGFAFLIAFAAAFLLFILNKEFVGMLEGYPFARIPFLSAAQTRKFRHCRATLAKLYAERRAGGGPFDDPEKERVYTELLQYAFRYFPRLEQHILPTALGNTIRAFETYSYDMYGFDAIPGWYRLLAVVPGEFQKKIESAKSRVDFWINIYLMALGLGLSGLFFVLLDWHATWQQVHAGPITDYPAYLCAFVAALPVLWFSRLRAIEAAAEWGEFVRAAFDIYLPVLAAQAGWKLPNKPDEVRAFWQKLGYVFIYGDDRYLPDRVAPVAASPSIEVSTSD